MIRIWARTTIDNKVLNSIIYESDEEFSIDSFDSHIHAIRENIRDMKGEKYHFKFRGTRGQVDEFDGVITDTFKGIFLVQSILDDRVKSYSYSDILIENLTIEKDTWHYFVKLKKHFFESIDFFFVLV